MCVKSFLYYSLHLFVFPCSPSCRCPPAGCSGVALPNSTCLPSFTTLRTYLWLCHFALFVANAISFLSARPLDSLFFLNPLLSYLKTFLAALPAACRPPRSISISCCQTDLPPVARTISPASPCSNTCFSARHFWYIWCRRVGVSTRKERKKKNRKKSTE